MSCVPAYVWACCRALQCVMCAVRGHARAWDCIYLQVCRKCTCHSVRSNRLRACVCAHACRCEVRAVCTCGQCVCVCVLAWLFGFVRAYCSILLLITALPAGGRATVMCGFGFSVAQPSTPIANASLPQKKMVGRCGTDVELNCAADVVGGQQYDELLGMQTTSAISDGRTMMVGSDRWAMIGRRHD